VLSNQVFRILQLFMNLLCTILGYDISNNHSTPSGFYIHYLALTCLYVRVNHVCIYVSCIVCLIFLLYIWACTLE